MWTNGEFSLHLSLSRMGRWVLPQFMVSNQFLRRDSPKIVPKVMALKHTGGGDTHPCAAPMWPPSQTPRRRLPPPSPFETSLPQPRKSPPPQGASPEHPQPAQLLCRTLVYGDDHILWWLGMAYNEVRPQSEVWVDVEKVPSMRTPTHYVVLCCACWANVQVLHHPRRTAQPATLDAGVPSGSHSSQRSSRAFSRGNHG